MDARDRRFDKALFNDFRRMATDESLSPNEKIGFPNSYRNGKGHAIFTDITEKLTSLDGTGKTVLEIGPGCGELALMLINLCKVRGHTLVLIDSAEMLAHLPDQPFVMKIAAYYPQCEDLLEAFNGKVDVMISYSVLHYVFAESNVWNFLDRSLELLSHGGEMLLGDIPNISKRKRFFSSPAGIRFHQEFVGTEESPKIIFNKIEGGQIDDSVIFSILMRARNQGFDAYVLPQRADLPMANRREDILIRRP